MSGLSYRPRNLSLGIVAAGVVLLVVGLFIWNNGHCSAMVPACVAAVMTGLLGLLACGRAVFERRQRQEEHDAAEYHRQHGGTGDLFGDADEAVRLATRTNRQFKRYFVPAATIALGVQLGVFVLQCWLRWRGQMTSELAPNPMPMAILAFCCCIGTLVGGSFFIGVSREPGCRWIRPAAAWLFLSGSLFMLASLVLFCEHFKRFADSADLFFSRFGVVVLGVLAVELILSFVIEFYRPRMPNEEERPLPESRLLALFTEPGSVARNVADSLDYQFGFRVSDAWFYRFLERTIVPLFMLMVAAFWFMTCIVVVNPYETALRERFGRAINEEPLGPGVYFKLPYPFETIYRFSSTRVQQLTIEGHDHNDLDDMAQPGEEEEDDGHGHSHGPKKKKKKKEVDKDAPTAFLWKIEKKHGGEADFLVGAKNVSIDVNVPGRTSTQHGVGLLSAHIPLFYKVKNLHNYTYNTKDTEAILKNIGQRELLEYFIQSDWNTLLGVGRGEASVVLRQRIQKVADDLQLGVEVVFVALTGMHPPAGVGASFERITQATVDRQRMIQDARTDAARTLSVAETASHLKNNQATAHRDRQVSSAEAEGGRFAGQLLCYRAAPKQFMLNSYFDVLEKEGSLVRKYLVTGENWDEILWLNLERKERSGLLDLNMPGN